MYGLRLDVLRISNGTSDVVSATELSKRYEKWIEKRLVWLEREAETRDSVVIKVPGGVVEIRGRFEDADEKTDDFVNMDGDADAIEKFHEKIIDLIVSEFKFYSLHIVIRPQVKKNEDGIETLEYLDFARIVEHMPTKVKAVSIEGYRSEHRDDVRIMLSKCPLESLKIHGEKGVLIPKAFFYQLKTDNLKELIIDCQTDVDKAVLERLEVPTLKIRSQNLVDTDISEYLKKWVATRNDDHSLEIAFRRRRNMSKTDQFKIVHKCKSACPSCCNHLKHRVRDVEEVLRPLHLDEVKYPGEKPYLVAEVLAAHWAEPHGLALKPPF